MGRRRSPNDAGRVITLGQRRRAESGVRSPLPAAWEKLTSPSVASFRQEKGIALVPILLVRRGNIWMELGR